MKNKIVLLSIPSFNTVYMPLGIPYLTGNLKGSGFNVVQRDLNAAAYDFFLSREYLQKCFRRTFLKNNAKYHQIIKNVKAAKESMKDLTVYKDFDDFSKNKKILEEAFKIISFASREQLEVYGNTFKYEPREYYEKNKKISYKSRKGLLNSIKNKKDNIFYYFFKRQTLPFLKRVNPYLIGISIFDQKQLIVAFVLSSLIKESGIDAKIVLGGNIITRISDVFSKDDFLNRKLFKYIDFIIHHEGEVSLKQLAERLLFKNYKFDRIPKLIYKKNGKIVENLEFNITNLDNILMPDFDGFDINLHWTPKPVISYLTKRGCPHHCDFCDTPFGYDGYYKLIEIKTGKKFKIIDKKPTLRAFPIKRVVKEVKHLKERYKSEYFSFVDEELTASFLNYFCRELIKKKVDIKWECYARMEPGFKSKPFCNLLKKAGCMFLQFGLESASQKVLDYENKKTRVLDYPLILENIYKANIMNNVFILIGTPRDNLFEAVKILGFLEKFGKYIYTIKPTIYKTSKWSFNSFNAELKGLAMNKNNPDLDIYLDMWHKRPKYGMSFKQAEVFIKILELWVKYKHKVNPVTRTYIYAQRLFIGPKLIKKFSKSVKVNKALNSLEEETLFNFGKILQEELKRAAYILKEDFIQENANKEYLNFKLLGRKEKTKIIKKFSFLYNSEKNKRLFFDGFLKLISQRKNQLTLDEIINFSERLQRID
jgi:anaerobic magnesium-protoporphyrin IX monomethyl ester cyclase